MVKFYDALSYFDTSEFQDALDDHYANEIELEDDHFHILYPPHILYSPPIRTRRKASQDLAQRKLTEANKFHASNIFPRLPDFIPPFNDRTTSVVSVPSLPPQKAEKRWRLSTTIPSEVMNSKKSKRKNNSSIGKSCEGKEKEPWSVDESELTLFKVDVAMMKKYNEFVSAITGSNISPLDPRFENRRWGIKPTRQKHHYVLWRAELSASHRVKFFVNEKKHKVIVISVNKHD